MSSAPTLSRPAAAGYDLVTTSLVDEHLLDVLLTAAGDAVGADGTVSPAGVAAAEEAARVQSQMEQLNCKAVLATLQTE